MEYSYPSLARVTSLLVGLRLRPAISFSLQRIDTGSRTIIDQPISDEYCHFIVKTAIRIARAKVYLADWRESDCG